MPKLLKILSVVAAVICIGGTASAASITEDFVFNYVSNTPFTITELSYSLAGSSNPNLLTGLQSYVTTNPATPVYLSGSGQLSELISINPSANYVTTVGVNPAIATYTATISAVSAVPLPAGFPLFALAIVCLIGLGYKARRDASSPSAQAAGIALG